MKQRNMQAVVIVAALLLPWLTSSRPEPTRRYVSEWTDIPASESVVFEHMLHSWPMELFVWVNLGIGEGCHETSRPGWIAPYQETKYIHVSYASETEIVVHNDGPCNARVQVVALP